MCYHEPRDPWKMVKGRGERAASTGAANVRERLPARPLRKYHRSVEDASQVVESTAPAPPASPSILVGRWPIGHSLTFAAL